MDQENIAEYQVAEILRNGCPLTIRAIRPDAKQLLLDAFHQLQESSIRLRFFGLKKQVTVAELKWATEVDFRRHVALLACVEENEQQRVIGAARYIAHQDPSPASTAEVAFAVEEDYHGQGVATLLLKHLVSIARAQGVGSFEAEVLPENKAMLRVFERSGLSVDCTASVDSVRVTMSLG